MVHEPRKGRFSFHGPTDVRRFVELCGQAGMYVALRPGPFVGFQYDAGGLPSWLLEMPGVALREANEPFQERVSLYFRKLLGELADLQVTHGGPLILIQSEHAWLCSNSDQADRYLREVTRYVRENQINIPIINTNDLWQESVGTIDTWRGWKDLLIQLRQLRAVQPRAPRIVSQFSPTGVGLWGAPRQDERTPQELMNALAQVLAAGAQPIVSPFHGGTNFGFLGGRTAGRPDGFVTTAAAATAPLGETGFRGPRYHALRRLVTFASHFGHVFADLSPDYHPVALDLSELEATGGSSRASGRRVSIVHLRGGAGQVVFVFADGPRRDATLLLEEGIRLPVSLGDQAVGWYVMDVDLRGAGRLDYTNLMPWAIVGRSTLVVSGPAKSIGYLSIDGSPLEQTVPSGNKPAVIEHKGVKIVICNQEQIDRAYHDEKTVYVGVAGLTPAGAPIPMGRTAAAWAIGKANEPEAVEFEEPALPQGGKSVELSEWQASPSSAYVEGTSPRYATLDGPQTLTACGAALGYGWYRMELKVVSTRKRKLHMPEVADRAHLFVDGSAGRILGVGPAANHGPFDQSLAKGPHTLVALVDNLGRFAEGNDLGERKGLYGHVWEVKKLATAKPNKVQAHAVDPFSLRGYIAGRTRGQLSDTNQVAWAFSHTRKTPILVDVDGVTASGTIVLNDQPIAYYAGASGGCLHRILLEPGETAGMKRGKNEVRFAPDLRQPDACDEASKKVTVYECVESITEKAEWAFAKWEPPVAASYRPLTRTGARDVKGVPCWWRTSFVVKDTPLPLRLDTTGLSKGQAFMNGNNLGRYFTATADSKAVGPQKWLYIPKAWVKINEHNELLIFDEHGFAPHRTSIVFSDADED